MKFLLTGLPGVGKSTIVDKIVSSLRGCTGILARENRKEGERVGFIAENWLGETKQFMRKTDKPSKNSVGYPGHWYEVDVDAIDTFIVSTLQQASRTDQTLLYIDEIGKAQMKSIDFISLIRTLLLEPQKNILATIVYVDDPGSPSLEFKQYPNICLLEVTHKNRNALPKILIAAFKNVYLFKRLDSKHQRKIFYLLQQLIKNEQYISAEKIFTNALDYFVNNKFILLQEQGPISQYLVQGKTREHQVNYHCHTKAMSCDCDLSTGSGCYEGCSQTCSHQITILLADTLFAPLNGLFELKQKKNLKTHDHEAPAPVFRSRL